MPGADASTRNASVACDFQSYCPELRKVNGGRARAPSLPAVKP